MVTTVAVTGATGFIGQHVVRQLDAKNIRLVALSRTKPSALPPNATWQAFDLDDVDEAVFEQLEAADCLIHLAWADLSDSLSNTHLERELPRQYDFLSTAIPRGPRSVLCAGTCFEYGMQQGILPETAPASPRTSYGLAKDRLRRQLQSLQYQTPFALQWARIFYIYGDGKREESLWTQFHRAVLEGEASFDMSGGQQVRDFLPVEEIARLITKLALTKTNAGIVNICSGEPITVENLVRSWAADTGWNGSLNLGHYPYVDYEPMDFWGDNSKLKCLLSGKAIESGSV